MTDVRFSDGRFAPDSFDSFGASESFTKARRRYSARSESVAKLKPANA
jgi:hypothetical protein